MGRKRTNDAIFYSWQSDLPNATNRGLIERALQRSIAALRKRPGIRVSPAVDRDTFGISGAPDIADSIFTKIDSAIAVVCDISIIDPHAARPAPNPNVLVELGYALKALGSERVLLVMNTAFGGLDQLPFDLRQRRVICYSSHPEDASRVEPRDSLASTFASALEAILREPGSARRLEVCFPDGSKVRTVRKRKRAKGGNDPKARLVPRTVSLQPVLRNTGNEVVTDVDLILHIPRGLTVWTEDQMRRHWVKFPKVGLEHAFDHVGLDQRTAQERVNAITREVFGFGMFKTYTGEDLVPVSRAPGKPLSATIDGNEVCYSLSKLKPGMARICQPLFVKGSKALDSVVLRCDIIGESLDVQDELRIRRRSAV